MAGREEGVVCSRTVVRRRRGQVLRVLDPGMETLNLKSRFGE